MLAFITQVFDVVFDPVLHHRLPPGGVRECHALDELQHPVTHSDLFVGLVRDLGNHLTVEFDVRLDVLKREDFPWLRNCVGSVL